MTKASRQFRNVGQRESSATCDGFRSLEVRASTLNVDQRSIEADVATDSPVPMPDFSRMEMVPEILVMEGAEIPKSRQVPFLDSHQRSSVGNQLGSARDIGIQNGRMSARLVFSASAENEFAKVREGHVTDVSAGYQVQKRVFVPAGETKKIMGREYSGPANVITKWKLREVSLTPIGADEQAKLRGLDPAAFTFPEERGFQMLKELREFLVSRGMDPNLTDEQAQKWMLENRSKTVDEIQPKTKEEPEQKRSDAGLSEAKIAEMIEAAQRKIFDDEKKRVAAFNSEVDATCDLAGLPDEKAHCRGLASIAEVRMYLTEKQKAQTVALPYSVSIRQTGSGFDELRKDMGTALSMRALEAAAGDSDKSRKAIDKIFPVDQRAKGADNFRYASLMDMATEWVRSLGVDTRGVSRENIAICALFGPEKAGLRTAGPAYHTTGNFSNLTLDATNKSMMLGYTETPSTWRGPMRQAASVPDFKNINRLRMGAVPNLPVWNDNDNPVKGSLADAREYYAVESYSLEIGFSYRLLVNDDMDALSRVPSMMGAAAARTVNAVAWTQITSNPTMSDGQALFSAVTGNRKRLNLTTGAGTPSVSTVQTLSNLMRQMRGENTPEQNESQDILNLMPFYIVGPGALATTIYQLVRSIADPAASQAGVYNTASVLTPIIEPLLDVASTTAWYLFADTSQIDTVEVTFLQGQETPIVRNFMDERALSQNMTVLQTFAAKAMNHRGIQKHAGA